MFSFITQAESRKKERKTDRLMHYDFLVVGMEGLHCNASEDFICSYF